MDGNFDQVTEEKRDETGENGMAGPATGDDRVDSAVAGLTSLTDIAVDEHPAVLGQVHRRLNEILGEVEPGDEQSPA